VQSLQGVKVAWGSLGIHSTSCICVKWMNRQVNICVTDLAASPYVNLQIPLHQDRFNKLQAQSHLISGNYQLQLPEEMHLEEQ